MRRPAFPNDASPAVTWQGPEEGDSLGFLGGGKVPGDLGGGAFAIGECVVPPGVPMAPPHTHGRVDEVSFVVEGELGVLVGDKTDSVQQGSCVLKPRGLPHTIWNPGDRPTRIVEIVSPAGFAAYLKALNGLLSAGGPPDVPGLVALAADDGVTMRMDRLPDVTAAHGVALPG